MNKKTLKVYLELLDNCGDWMDTQEIGFRTNLTSRQVCSIVSQFPSPPLERERVSGDHGVRVRWNEPLDNIEDRRNKAIIDYYNLTPDMHKTVLDSLSTVGWMTVYDICSETGLSKDAVARIVRISKDVETETSGRMSLYRKSLEASD